VPNCAQINDEPEQLTKLFDFLMPFIMGNQETKDRTDQNLYEIPTQRRPHSSLKRKTPDQVYYSQQPLTLAA